MNDPSKNPSQDSAGKMDLSHFKCRVRLRERPGEAKEVSLDARDLEAAVRELWDQGYLVVAVEEAGKWKKQHPNRIARFNAFIDGIHQGKGRRSKASRALFPGVSNRELIFFAVQLSTLLKAGVPLFRALDIIRKGNVNPFFQTLLDSLKKKVAEGNPLHQALQEHGKVFPWVWINLVEVGESTGRLPESLAEIARYQESAARIKSKIITAFFYPGILSLAVLSALTFLLIFIIPKFSAIFAAQHIHLPAITQAVVAVSDLLRQHFIPLVVVVATCVGGALYAARFASVRLLFDIFWLGAPVFGELLLQVAVVRFCRSLGTLLRSGVQILQALNISGRLLENRFLELRIHQVSTAVRGGQSLGAQLEARNVFPVFMTQLITVGEESGQLERFLDLLANYYEEQVDTFLGRLTVLLEPFLLIFMGAVIGTIVISMFLPIIQLSTGGAAG